MNVALQKKLAWGRERFRYLLIYTIAVAVAPVWQLGTADGRRETTVKARPARTTRTEPYGDSELYALRAVLSRYSTTD